MIVKLSSTNLKNAIDPVHWNRACASCVSISTNHKAPQQVTSTKLIDPLVFWFNKWLIICCKTCQNIRFWTCTNSDCTPGVRLHMSAFLAFCRFYSCLVYNRMIFNSLFGWKLSYQPCTNKEDVNVVEYYLK